MSDKIHEKYFCPICKNPAEVGFLADNSSAFLDEDWETAFRELEWFAGEPGVLKRLTTLGESVGKTSYFQGSYATGIHCNSCKKIILDI